MGDFNQAVDFVLANEGGFVDNANDSGGATNFGISLRFLREIPSDRLKKYGVFAEPSLADIKEMTQAQAILIYQWEFWIHANFEIIIDQRICNYAFDMCVLHGSVTGTKLIQRATWSATLVIDYVIDDGIMGRSTLDAINLLSSEKEFISFRSALVGERMGYCRMIAELRPKDKDNLHGWLKRCCRF